MAGNVRQWSGSGWRLTLEVDAGEDAKLAQIIAAEVTAAAEAKRATAEHLDATVIDARDRARLSWRQLGELVGVTGQSLHGRLKNRVERCDHGLESIDWCGECFAATRAAEQPAPPVEPDPGPAVLDLAAAERWADEIAAKPKKARRKRVR